MPIKGTFTGSHSFGALEAPAGPGINANGGSISYWNGWTIHTFTSSGTFSVASIPATGQTMEFMVVGGGGPGGNGLGGGGGGGAVIHEQSHSAQTGSYTVTVAAQSPVPGGQTESGIPNARGYDSSLQFPNGTVMTAEGGGLGGWWNGQVGWAGGCGGGGSNKSNGNSDWVDGGNTRQPDYGCRGGKGQRYPDDNSNNDHRAGGGGGAGGAGHWTCGTDSYYTNYGNGAGNGGATGGCGFYINFDGTARYWAGGGGGSAWNGTAGGGNGGLGGGGGGNHHNDNNKSGGGGGTALNAGGAASYSGGGGNGGTNTGGGGGGSSGVGWGAGPGGRGGSGIVMIRYRTDNTDLYATGNYGLTEATAAESAYQIKQNWADAPTGTYWIKPSNSAPAYQVHCLMDIEGGGWELACRTNSWDFGPNSSSNPLHGGWSGWLWTNKSQCDSLNTSYKRAGDRECISPSAVYQNFRDVMMISNQNYAQRMGHRWNSTQNPITWILNQSGSNWANTELFGGKNVLALQTRACTNNTYGGGAYFGFNAYSDSGSGAGSIAGGQPSNGWGWARSQIGVGRNNTTNNYFGGGMGSSAQSDYNQFGGHWWGHGSGRSPHYWSGDRASGWYGQSVYIRRTP